MMDIRIIDPEDVDFDSDEIDAKSYGEVVYFARMGLHAGDFIVHTPKSYIDDIERLTGLKLGEEEYQRVLKGDMGIDRALPVECEGYQYIIYVKQWDWGPHTPR
ncbi:MAG TPA: hypothetical protein VGD31_17325 [Sphingobacteriaceae bacterium]